MFCPQCGTESTTSDQQFCRSCGANLKVIRKAVSLGEAIARSDRGPLPKLKEMMKNLKVEQVTEEISRAMEQMHNEMIKHAHESKLEKLGRFRRREKTAAQRRERHIVRGTISLFSGTGLMIFLYFLSTSLDLKLPPVIVNDAPFHIQSLVHVIWLVGLIPVMSGLGHIIAGLTIRPSRVLASPERTPELEERHPITVAPVREDKRPDYEAPPSVTERTTNILHHVTNSRPTSEIER